MLAGTLGEGQHSAPAVAAPSFDERMEHSSFGVPLYFGYGLREENPFLAGGASGFNGQDVFLICNSFQEPVKPLDIQVGSYPLAS